MSTLNSSSLSFQPAQSCLLIAIDAAVRWWSEYLKKTVSLEALKKFESSLKDALMEKIKDHWYPDMPSKGQGYRSLSMDKKAHWDPVLQKAAVSGGFLDTFVSFFKDLDSVLMWIDPDVVVVRLSYTGYINIPPEEKILYRSPIPAKSPVFPPPVKTSPPLSSSPLPSNRSTIIRPPATTSQPIRPPSPSSQTYLASFRTNSTTPPPYYGPPNAFSSPHKNPYTAQPSQRNSVYYNNGITPNQSQYIWYNDTNNYTTNLSNISFNGNNFTSNAKPTQIMQQPMYMDYFGSERHLETQANKKELLIV